jgi:DNA-binding SARP family transcriptional activator/tetratricopeptide (TPR) repeat protein
MPSCSSSRPPATSRRSTTYSEWVQFRLLGPVEIEAGGELRPLPRRRERCLLAVLLLEANRVVPVSQLAELLWDGDPPDRARRMIYGQVSRLRAALATSTGREDVALATVGDGYRIEVDPYAVDAHRFRMLLEDAAACSGDLADRVDRIRAALDLWRGPALGNAASPWLRARVCADLAEQRLAAIEDMLSASLALRREREILPELARIAAEHPDRESLVALHMRALYQAERKPAALEVYESARAYLAGELGLDPGPGLRELQLAILRDQLEVSAPPAGEPRQCAPATRRTGPPASVPGQLPADVRGFVGREAQLAALDALLTGTAGTSEVAIAAVGGTAGVGKTALAIHWGHRMRDRFPDGQLYADLRGHSPGAPRAPLEVLAGFLHALGTPGNQVPANVDEAAARYRSLLSGKRILVVLDNAGEAEQVRPLLPGAPGCVVVVTSRSQLGGLVARDGAHWLRLDVLTTAEARLLLERMLGGQRVHTEPEPAAELAWRCGYLPLALRVAAANLTTRPQSIADFLAQWPAQDRLAALAVGGDPDSAVAASFDLSYAGLPDPARRMFRLLGLAPGPDLTAEAGAALAGMPVGQAAGLLRTLAWAHLLDERVAGRYACHDLLRAYAADRAVQEEVGADRDAARRRLLDWYAGRAQAAAETLYPHMLRLPADDAPDDPAWTFEDPAGAHAWLTGEHANLLSAISLAAEHGPRPAAWRLAHALRGYWWQRSSHVDWQVAATAAEEAAGREGDLTGQAAAQLGYAALRQLQGRHGEALVHSKATVELAGQAGWVQGRAAGLSCGAISYTRLGELDRAIANLAEAQALNERLGLLAAQANDANNLGVVYHERGQLGAAAQQFTRALALNRELDSPASVRTMPLNNLALVARDHGRLADARDHATEALALCRELGNRTGEANTLDTLATVHRDAGDYPEALAAAEAAVRLADELGDRRIQAAARNTRGTVHRCLGRARQAIDDHRRAVVLARRTSNPELEFDALRGMAAAHHDLGGPDRAMTFAARALDLARERGYRLREGQALTSLAEIHLGLDDRPVACRHAGLALDIHRQTGHRLGEARTLLILGQVWQRAGDVEAAQDHRRRAHRLLHEIGSGTATGG